MPDAVGIDFIAAIGGANSGQQIAERKPLPDHTFRDAERIGNVRDRPALLYQPGKRFPLGDLVWVETCNVFDQRSLERRRIIARLKKRAGQRFDLATLIKDGLRRVITPPSGDDLKRFRGTILPDQQWNQNASGADRWQDVGDIRGFLSVPHVQSRNIELAKFYVSEFHINSLLGPLGGEPAPFDDLSRMTGGAGLRRDGAIIRLTAELQCFSQQILDLSDVPRDARRFGVYGQRKAWREI